MRVLRVPETARPSRGAAEAWLARVTVRVALNIADSERARHPASGGAGRRSQGRQEDAAHLGLGRRGWPLRAPARHGTRGVPPPRQAPGRPSLVRGSREPDRCAVRTDAPALRPGGGGGRPRDLRAGDPPPPRPRSRRDAGPECPGRAPRDLPRRANGSYDCRSGSRRSSRIPRARGSRGCWRMRRMARRARGVGRFAGPGARVGSGRGGRSGTASRSSSPGTTRRPAWRCPSICSSIVSPSGTPTVPRSSTIMPAGEAGWPSRIRSRETCGMGCGDPRRPVSSTRSA